MLFCCVLPFFTFSNLGPCSVVLDIFLMLKFGRLCLRRTTLAWKFDQICRLFTSLYVIQDQLLQDFSSFKSFESDGFVISALFGCKVSYEVLLELPRSTSSASV